MGTVIDFEQARRRHEERQAEASGLTDLDVALARLEPVIRLPFSPANAAVVERELTAIHRLIGQHQLQEATERIERLHSRLSHASARRSS